MRQALVQASFGALEARQVLQQHGELIGKGKMLQGHHVVAFCSDIDAIKAAFAHVQAAGGQKARPRVQGDTQFHDLDEINVFVDGRQQYACARLRAECVKGHRLRQSQQPC